MTPPPPLSDFIYLFIFFPEWFINSNRLSLFANLSHSLLSWMCFSPLAPLYQYDGFPFHKASADVDWNTLQQLSKSNCVCPSLLVPHVRSQKKGLLMPDAFISATVLPWMLHARPSLMQTDSAPIYLIPMFPSFSHPIHLTLPASPWVTLPTVRDWDPFNAHWFFWHFCSNPVQHTFFFFFCDQL